MGTKLTYPFSTTVDLRTPYCDEDSPDDYRTAPGAYHFSLVSLTRRRQSSAIPKQVFKDPIT